MMSSMKRAVTSISLVGPGQVMLSVGLNTFTIAKIFSRKSPKHFIKMYKLKSNLV